MAIRIGLSLSSPQRVAVNPLSCGHCTQPSVYYRGDYSFLVLVLLVYTVVVIHYGEDELFSLTLICLSFMS